MSRMAPTSTKYVDKTAYYDQDISGYCQIYRLVGLAVKASASRAEDPWFESRLPRIFSG